MKCPTCDGKGDLIGMCPVWSEHVKPEDRKLAVSLPCFVCDGSGEVSDDMSKWIEHGGSMSEHRIAAGFGLRQAAELLGQQPSQVAEIESGRVDNSDFPVGYTTPKAKATETGGLV